MPFVIMSVAIKVVSRSIEASSLGIQNPRAWALGRGFISCVFLRLPMIALEL